MEEGKQSKIMRVLMLPWLAHGHISPFLELARRLAVSWDFHIYICSTPVNIKSIQKKITEYSRSIDLVELHLPSSPELPPHYHTTNGLPPHLMTSLKKAYEKSAPQFSNIMHSLHPDLVIYDFNQPWAAEIASSQDIPAVQFITQSTAFMCFVLHFIHDFGKEFPYPEIYLRDYWRNKLRDLCGNEVNDTKEKDIILGAMERSHKILLIRSIREIEDKFIDFLSVLSVMTGKKVVPAGPLVRDLSCDDDEGEDKEIMEWLDQKERSSVVFVSFGSEYFLTKEERDAISKGLELSNVSFIWVIRFPAGEDISIQEALPERFLDRIGKRGKIVNGWAPQAKILKHSSTGAFVSHCGMSSMMESMKWGVPIIAVPMQIDQPLNARVVEAVGLGIEAIRDDKGNLQSEEIAQVIRKVLLDDGGEEVRRKATELREKLEMKGDEEIDILREELIGLCRKNDGKC